MEGRLKTRLDYEDLWAIPEDGNRYEIVDGDLQATPAPTLGHQRLVLRLARTLAERFHPPAEVFIGPVAVILGRHDVVQPDTAVVADTSGLSERAIEGPPLLVVEVSSPSTRTYDRTTKARRYAVLGVPHYWIAAGQARRVECYRRRHTEYDLIVAATGEEVLAHPDFPGLVIDFRRLFGR
ncbi:MAG TPA: Uma2 family endonuclease [Candidatus Tectomicrobia bacterium]|nr:Uma2 family endonuclease [Candidatus Tectomicrobia bacterium]